MATCALHASAQFYPSVLTTVPKTCSYINGWANYCDSKLTDDGTNLFYNGLDFHTAEIRPSSRPFADVRSAPYNAVCDGVHDDTVAINACITAMHRSTLNCGLGSIPPTNSCTGVCLIPNVFCAASQIKFQNNVELDGTGWTNSGLLQLPGSNEDFVTGTNPATDQRFSIKNLYLNGNGVNQTGAFDCIHWDSTGTLEDSTRSPRHTLENDYVSNCGQDAINLSGEAGSSKVINTYGMNSGRYGMYNNTYDTQILGGEFGSNIVGGVFQDIHGNGSIIGVKSWGNGNGTVQGFGYTINGGNTRANADEAQDNSCNGFVYVGVRDIDLEAFLADGNGFAGGGNGCAGIVLNGSSYGRISGMFVGVVDAGQSDYAIAYLNNSLNLVIDMVVDNPKISTYSGSNGTNALRINGQNITSAAQNFNGGGILSGFSDNTTTKQWVLDTRVGQLSIKQILPLTLYSAAGTPVPTCNSAILGETLNVSDATSPTYRGTYTSGGTILAAVQCNGTNWLTY